MVMMPDASGAAITCLDDQATLWYLNLATYKYIYTYKHIIELHVYIYIDLLIYWLVYHCISLKHRRTIDANMFFNLQMQT